MRDENVSIIDVGEVGVGVEVKVNLDTDGGRRRRERTRDVGIRAESGGQW